ncbi:MAG: hypothetical protein K8H88_25780, partial [Sandaracinaceae bacterium]|nr:hypothetical protein [Sandaracinaceae bacterium]
MNRRLLALGWLFTVGCGGGGAVEPDGGPLDAGPACGAGLNECDGLCVDFGSDRSHCGACGNVCGADEDCTGGACALHCPGSLVECGGACR